MIRPLEDRTNPGEYVNRVKRPDHDHAPGSRDFAYEVGEVSSEQKNRQRSREFGEDTYEHADDKSETPNESEGKDTHPETPPPPADEGSLDITV